MSPYRKACCISGCNNTSRRKRGFDTRVKFYKFPASILGVSWKISKRKQWINVVKNHVKNSKDWVPNENTRICSTHFINNEKSEHPSHPSYVPSIFPRKEENVKKSIQSLGRFERLKFRQLTKALSSDQSVASGIINNDDNNITSNIPIEQDGEQYQIDVHFSNLTHKPAQRSISCQTEMIADHTVHNSTYFFCNLDYRDGLSTAAVQVNIPMKKTVDKICEADIHILKKNIRDFGCDPMNVDLTKPSCQGFHGFPSITTDEAMSSLTGVTLAIFSFLLTVFPDCKTAKISKKTNLLITLMKLKTGLSFTALAVLFNIHRTTANRIFVKHLQQLNILSKNFVFWPSKATIRATLPESFKKHYPETRVIIDCTEVSTEVPPQVNQRVLMYSEYKHHYTIKFLVGCAPNGFISFVSKCYGGRAGDCFITNDCGIIDLIESGDVVLADKGFPQIKTQLENKNAVFVMPPFGHKDQFTREEVDETYNIASVRIHIERVNQRIKDFKIMSKIPVSLFPHIDEIVFVICALVNIQNPLFKEKE